MNKRKIGRSLQIRKHRKGWGGVVQRKQVPQPRERGKKKYCLKCNCIKTNRGDILTQKHGRGGGVSIQKRRDTRSRLRDPQEKVYQVGINEKGKSIKVQFKRPIRKRNQEEEIQKNRVVRVQNKGTIGKSVSRSRK